MLSNYSTSRHDELFSARQHGDSSLLHTRTLAFMSGMLPKACPVSIYSGLERKSNTLAGRSTPLRGETNCIWRAVIRQFSLTCSGSISKMLHLMCEAGLGLLEHLVVDQFVSSSILGRLDEILYGRFPARICSASAAR